MDRKSSSTLAGAVFLSFMLSLGLKPVPGGGEVAAAYDGHAVVGRAQAALGAGVESNREKHATATPDDEDKVRARAQDSFRRQIDGLVQSTCAPGESCKHDANEFLIALVPDPVHTHLALRFDRVIESIEEGMQDQGFVFDRAIMPWDSKTHLESDDYENREEAAWSQAAREDLPGLMVFRGDSHHEHQWRFIWAVSDTPTRGIQRSQFLKAAAAIPWRPGMEWNAGKSWRTGKSSDPVLRILGPTYSGSLASLEDLLACPSSKPCYPEVSVYSGTVSSRSAVLAFTQHEDEKDLNMRFVSFQESDDVMIERFVEFMAGNGYGTLEPARASPSDTRWDHIKQSIKILARKLHLYSPERTEETADQDNRHYRTEKMAILSEDETAYGEPPPQSGTAPAGSEGEIPANCGSPDGQKNLHCILKLYFPREISQLRAAYQDTLVGGPPATDTHNPGRITLPSNFSVPGSDDDTVAAYSGKEMPLSQESVMLSIVSELRKHTIEFVILRATDPMDSLFLSEYLRSAFPQGRIVTTGADLLYRREADDPRLHGLLALSTYSLAPSANHNFTSYEKEHIERIFPSSDAAGTYNAIQALVAAPEPQGDSGCTEERGNQPAGCRHEIAPTDPPIFLYQYGWLEEQCPDCLRPDKFEDPKVRPECDYCAPPVRLLALGRDQYWPVASLGPFEHEGSTTLPRIRNQLQLGGTVTPVEIPKSWRLVQLVAIALGLSFSWCLWFSSIFSKTQALAKFSPAVDDSRLPLILVAGLSLILIMLILLWPSAHVQPFRWKREFLVDWLLCLAAAVVFISSTVEWITRCWLSDPSPAARAGGWKRYTRYIPFVVFALAAAFFSWRVLFRPTEESSAFVTRFSALRAVQLTSGLSFVMPWFFLLVVWLWWAGHITVGFAMFDDRRPRLQIGAMHKTLGRFGDEYVQKELAPIYHLGGGRNVLYWAIPTIFIVCYYFLGDTAHPIMTLERPRIEQILSIFIALAFAGTIRATFKLWEIWLGARKLLVALDATPLQRGFRSMKELHWKPIWRMGEASLEEFQRVFNRKKEALDAAIRTVPILNVTVEQELDKVRELSKAAREQFHHPFTFDWWERRKAEREVLAQFGRLQTTIAKAAGVALNYLEWFWSVERPGAAVGKMDASDPRVAACERLVCLTYVDFLLVVLVRVRTLIVAIGGMYVFILIGITQYPFEPRGAIQVTLVLLLAFIVVVVGMVLAQIYRDATLSTITETTPGELGRDFWVRMAGFVALPLFSLLASQFPSVNRFFYSWLQPAIQALNR